VQAINEIQFGGGAKGLQNHSARVNGNASPPIFSSAHKKAHMRYLMALAFSLTPAAEAGILSCMKRLVFNEEHRTPIEILRDKAENLINRIHSIRAFRLGSVFQTAIMVKFLDDLHSSVSMAKQIEKSLESDDFDEFKSIVKLLERASYFASDFRYEFDSVLYQRQLADSQIVKELYESWVKNERS
jgi:hypothetical protein